MKVSPRLEMAGLQAVKLSLDISMEERREFTIPFLSFIFKKKLSRILKSNSVATLLTMFLLIFCLY